MFIEPIDNLLRDLDMALKSHKVVVLTGKGGMGKTTTASAYRNKYKQNYANIMQIELSGTNSIDEAIYYRTESVTGDDTFSTIKNNIDEAKKRSNNTAELNSLYTTWREKLFATPLNRELPYLFTIDGYDNPQNEMNEIISSLGSLQTHSLCKLLITSRSNDFFTDDEGVHCIPMPYMSEQKALELLSSVSGKKLTNEELPFAIYIVHAIAGYYPLAIKVIGRYLSNMPPQFGFEDFVNLYETEEDPELRMRIYNEDPNSRTSLPDSISDKSLSWIVQKGYEAAERESNSAPVILGLCLSLSNSPIPTDLLNSLTSFLPDYSYQTLYTGLNSAVGKGLLDWTNPEKNSFELHPIVNDVLSDTCEIPSQKDVCLRLVEEILKSGNGVVKKSMFSHASKLCESEDLQQFPYLSRFQSRLLVHDAIRTGSLEKIFYQAKANRKTSHSGLRQIESEEWKQRMESIFAEVDAYYESPKDRNKFFVTLFLLSYYWHDGYLPQDIEREIEVAPPLLKSWENVHQDQDTKDLVACLGEFYASYPCLYKYNIRFSASAEWRTIQKCLKQVKTLLGIEESFERIDFELLNRENNLIRALYGFLFAYWVESELHLSVSKFHKPTARVWKFYEYSCELFSENDDVFHHSWFCWEQAEAHADVARSMVKPQDVFRSWSSQLRFNKRFNKHEEENLKKHLKTSADLCEKAMHISLDSLDIDLSSIENEPEVYLEEYESDVDGELFANIYAILAEVYALDPETENLTWGYHCASLLSAYAFMESQKDQYSLFVYSECVERLLDRLESLPLQSGSDKARAIQVCDFIQNFWSLYWQTHLLPTPDFTKHLLDKNRDELKKVLLPWLPTLEDIKKYNSPCRRCLAGVLESMPTRIEKLPKEYQPYRLKELAKLYQRESRRLNAKSTYWQLDSPPNISPLYLRKLRRDDVETLAEIAKKAFPDTEDSEVLKEMLWTHLNSPQTIPLNATSHTMLPTQYYVLTMKATNEVGVEESLEIIGMTGLYRTVWTDPKVLSLGWFLIDPDYQGKGIGSVLLDATIQLALKHDAKRLMIETSASLKSALKLYEKTEFVTVGSVNDYYQSGYNLLLLTRDISAVSSEEVPDGLCDIPLDNS
jgi:ribosomal protein S18 acetylase RimI-like enzyme